MEEEIMDPTTFESVKWEDLQDTLAFKPKKYQLWFGNNAQATVEHERCSGDGTRLHTHQVQTAEYGKKMQVI